MFDLHRQYRRPITRLPFFYRLRKKWHLVCRQFYHKLPGGSRPVKGRLGQKTFGRAQHRYQAKHYRRQTISSYGRARRPLLRAILVGTIIWAVLPIGLVTLQKGSGIVPRDVPPYSIQAAQKAVVSQSQGQKGFSGNMQVRLLDHRTNELRYIDLEEYVVGVVAAEMPASFGSEALKAQAVAARTYAVRRILQGASKQVLAQNQQAQLSSDHNINQAWIDEDERKKRWGDNFPGNETKIRQAVSQTQGIILLYDGQVIDPLYHASCGGERTEDIANVWGEKVPYLQSMKCSGHQDKHQNYRTVLDLARVDEKLGTTLNELPASSLFGKDRGDVCEIEEKTKSGRVISMSVMGKHYTGSEIRTKLELPSTNFQLAFNEDSLEIISQGYGHGVGMCQYGAADFAAKGESWHKILLHYYKGVQPAKIALKQ